MKMGTEVMRRISSVKKAQNAVLEDLLLVRMFSCSPGARERPQKLKNVESASAPRASGPGAHCRGPMCYSIRSQMPVWRSMKRK